MAQKPAAKGGAAESKPLMLPNDNDPNNLKSREARLQMRRENGAKSLPKSFITKLERKKGAR